MNQRKSGFLVNLTAQDLILPCSSISVGIVGLSKNSSPWTGLGCVDTKPLQRDRASLGSAHVPPAQIRAWQRIASPKNDPLSSCSAKNLFFLVPWVGLDLGWGALTQRGLWVP